MIVIIIIETTSAPSTPFLVVANGRYIREITLDGRSFRTSVSGQRNIWSLSYHYRWSACVQCRASIIAFPWHWHAVSNGGIHFLSRASHLYWGDAGHRTIMRSSLDGSNPVTIVDTGVIEPGRYMITTKWIVCIFNKIWYFVLPRNCRESP